MRRGRQDLESESDRLEATLAVPAEQERLAVRVPQEIGDAVAVEVEPLQGHHIGACRKARPLGHVLDRDQLVQFEVGRLIVAVSVALLFVDLRVALAAVLVGGFFWWNAVNDMRKWAAAGGIMSHYGIQEVADGEEE